MYIHVYIGVICHIHNLSHLCSDTNWVPLCTCKVYVNKKSLYSNSNYLSSTVSIVLSHYWGVLVACWLKCWPASWPASCPSIRRLQVQAPLGTGFFLSEYTQLSLKNEEDVQCHILQRGCKAVDQTTFGSAVVMMKLLSNYYTVWWLFIDVYCSCKYNRSLLVTRHVCIVSLLWMHCMFEVMVL